MPSSKKPTDPIDAKRFPNIAAERDWDREQHIRQAMANGLTRKQAEAHADQEMLDHED